MIITFIIRGRLGNAIFRYMACSIMCIYYNCTYNIENSNPLRDLNQISMSDNDFINICNNILQKKPIQFGNNLNILMNGFYQHDFIYKINKNYIINFIRNNPSHYIITDGIEAGDNRCQQFKIIDIIDTPINFTKKYKNVIHLRLEDFVTHNLYIDKTRIIELLKKNIIQHHLSIVCKKPNTEFEIEYIKYITNFLESNNINYNLQHNDVLTDYYIMKEAEILICSKSTLSWCAAFFSNKILKCYFPDYEVSVNSTCKSPIDNTELY
jgi:hypothetical protein